MDVSRPAFGSPILCIDNFLLETDATLVLQECIDLKRVYVPASVFDGPKATKVDTKFRKNDVVHINQACQAAPERSNILRIMKNTIWSKEYKELWHEGDYIFDIINYSTCQEAVVSRYGNCDFFGRHQDTRRDHITYRLVTIVYYVNQIPQQFTGGAITFWKGQNSLRIEPQHNRAVVFPSFTHHEVENVRMATDRWEDGRFSLNYWLGFR